jgi:alkylated DNA repair dioxygenase AlkB
MYDRVLEQPRSTAGFALGQRFDLPIVDHIAAALAARYAVTIGSVWCNLYCDGNDSVAWHGDRVLRDRSDGLVAIVSVGHRRRFLIKPANGGPSRTFELGRGDLFVMGGDCQRRWRHCVPKVSPASLVGPRISITMRPE